METYENDMERKEKQIDRLYSLVETKDDTIRQLNDLVKRQRVIIEMYNNCFDPERGSWSFKQLYAAYAAAQDTTAMTGASEK